MANRKDLESLARELLERLSAPLYRERSYCQVSCRTVRDLCTAVLSELAAEADGPGRVHEALASEHWYRETLALRAQLEAAAPLFEAAREYARDTAADFGEGLKDAAIEWAERKP